MKSRKSVPHYLRFIIIVIVCLVSAILVLALFTPATDNKTTEQQPNQPENLVGGNMTSFYKDDLSTEPTINEHSPTLGNPDAPIQIFEFSSFDCAYSAKIQPLISKLMALYPDKINFVWKDLPSGNDAMIRHRAARCAGEQNKFWDYHDLLFANQDEISADRLVAWARDLGLDRDSFASCLNSDLMNEFIDNDIKEADRLLISGTPHFYINTQELFGPVGLTDFKKIIDTELSR